MKGKNRKPNKISCGGCGNIEDAQPHQPFPKNGQLAKNLDLSLKTLKSKIEKVNPPKNVQKETYAYVLTSVGCDGGIFRQNGSAPNFQGGVLTLCTCKHYMRTSGVPLEKDNGWKSYWLAGFTSKKICDGKQWLFYLANIQQSYKSHSDLWHDKALWIKYEKNAKCASGNPLGDIFKPKNNLKRNGREKYDWEKYCEPCENHSHGQNGNTEWHKDIGHNYKTENPARLLVAEPEHTFLWTKPKIFYKNDLTQGCKKFKGFGK